MIFERLFRAFQENKLKYAVIGGIAVNLYGYNRVTGDLDIIMSLSDENIRKFILISNELKLIPRLPVKIEDFADSSIRKTWINEKNMKVFSVFNPQSPLEHIDIKIDSQDKIDYYLKNSIIMTAGDINISVVTIDDLIKLKKEAGRERDLVDIRALEKIKALDG